MHGDPQFFSITEGGGIPESQYVFSDPTNAQAELNKLCDLAAKFKANVLVGGNGFDILKLDHPAVSRRLINFEEVQKI